jgi:hypothetical protein
METPINQVVMQTMAPEDMDFFVAIVEGEVATFIAFSKNDERNQAAFSSSPTFVKVSYENLPQLGSTWDGVSFTAPESE